MSAHSKFADTPQTRFETLIKSVFFVWSRELHMCRGSTGAQVFERRMLLLEVMSDLTELRRDVADCIARYLVNKCGGKTALQRSAIREVERLRRFRW